MILFQTRLIENLFGYIVDPSEGTNCSSLHIQIAFFVILHNHISIFSSDLSTYIFQTAFIFGKWVPILGSTIDSWLLLLLLVVLPNSRFILAKLTPISRELASKLSKGSSNNVDTLYESYLRPCRGNLPESLHFRRSTLGV